MKWIGLVAGCCLLGVVQSQNPCTTPNGETAKCISIYKCSVFINALKTRTPETIRFMRASQCGYREDPLVCCGTVAKYEAVATPPPTRAPAVHRNIDLLPKKCGTQGILDRIIGGNVTGIDEFPWTALLEYRRNGKSVGHSCGGVLISERYVLTAAHCVVGDIKIAVGDLFRVRLGEHDKKTDPDCVDYGEEDGEEPFCADPPANVEIEEMMVHKQYVPDERSQYNDIALLRLNRAVSFTDYIRPICLPLSQEATAVGKNATVAGWGDTDADEGKPSDQKLKADIPIVLQSACDDIYRKVNIQLRKTQMCAGGQEGVDSCSGDSGGPLMSYVPGSSNMFVEGIVSFGPKRCGLKGWPGIYTRVSEYLEWIMDNMKP